MLEIIDVSFSSLNGMLNLNFVSYKKVPTEKQLSQ